MKALHVINSLAVGGAERLLSDLLPEIAATGISCSVLALDERNDAFSDRLRAAGIAVRFARPGGASPYSPARLRDVATAIRDEAPDIVHAHLGPSFHWCALASLASPGIPLVATEHASVNHRMRQALLRGFEKFCYGRYAAIACVSADAAAALEAWLGLPREKLPVIPNGIEPARFSRAKPAADVLEALAGRRGIAMVARFVPAKDHGAALEALRLLPSEYVLVLAGDGAERPAIEAKAREAGLSSRCLFLGAREDIPAILAASRCYLQTSKAEGFGIAALEAMAAGLPVAATRVPGLEPLVSGAGLLHESGDAEACAADIRRLCEDETVRGETISAGLVRAQGYSIQGSAAAYGRLYSRVLAERATKQVRSPHGDSPQQ